jgi:hypothetical protein
MKKRFGRQRKTAMLLLPPTDSAPADRSWVDCPLPEGEVSDHKKSALLTNNKKVVTFLYEDKI